jgi:hypothetical protein
MPPRRFPARPFSLVRLAVPRLHHGFVALVASAGISLLVASPAAARPPHKAAVIRYYGDLLPKQFQSCELCHLSEVEATGLPSSQRKPDEKKPWNAFGRTLQQLGAKQVADGAAQPGPILDRIRQVATLDADGDGVPNEIELLGGTSPANGSQQPQDDALATAQQVFQQFHQSEAALAWNPFQPVERPAVPNAGGSWVRNPIDAFVAAEHQRLGLHSRPMADKEALLRRVYLDLIGLPPTRDELHEFLSDTAADAYERMVDRLLASPRYGERWGRHWMDIWRYSDWAGWGQQVRDSQPHIWHWRDWIIESLNTDKGYDEMIVEMLAADEAKPADRDALRATGFLVRNYKRLSREQWMTEAVDHTARALLGATVKCAQCHDHMYDLLTQQEYYQFRAIFEPYEVRIDPLTGQLDPDKGGLPRVYDAQPDAVTYFYIKGDERNPDKSKTIVPGTPAFLGGGPLAVQSIELPLEGYYPALADFVVEENLSAARTKLDAANAAAEELPDRLAEAKRNEAEAELHSLEARVAAERGKYVQRMKSDEMLKELARVAGQQERLAAAAKAEVVLIDAEQQVKKLSEKAADDTKAAKSLKDAEKKLEAARKARDAAVAAAKEPSDQYSPLGPVYPRTSSGRRLALARWIANPQNPLTARVAVNHIWTRHFGRGLEPSTDEFGQNRRDPTHPALIDWLAAEFMAPSDGSHPWSFKHIHRLIVTSSAYRTSSTNDPACFALDPDNQYLWRTTPRRVEAEVIRDSVLYVAGSLDLTQGGPELDQTQGLKSPRRSLYFRSAPEKQMLFLQLFDMAAPTECYERHESVVPQQALALANSELTVREARRLARQLREKTSADRADFITAAFQQVLSRSPTDAEVKACSEFIGNQTAEFSQPNADFGDTTANPSELLKPSSEPAMRAAENLVHVLLNHHEFVSIR